MASRSGPPPTVPAPDYGIPPEEALARVSGFADSLAARRTVRDFSPRQVPDGVVEAAVRAAASAPSGANIQPWRFVLVSNAAVRRELRLAAEAEEREFYQRRASDEWRAALEQLGTDWRKPFLEEAPVLIVVFEVHKGPASPRPYYVKESVGIATGFLLAALHQAGLATLTHTPSPMRFLNRILDRPPEERAHLIIPAGYPAPGARVPAITRKALADVLTRV
jgi:nitroreductase